MEPEHLGDLARSANDMAAAVLFGSYFFVGVVARPAFRAMAGGDETWRAFARGHRIIVGAALLAAFLAMPAWQWSVAAIMSDAPLGDAVSPGLFAAVLRETSFGTMMALRMALLALLALLFLGQRKATPAGPYALPWRAGALLAGALLATVALTGHAYAETGPGWAWHLAADMIHLLAFGAWIGSLPLLFVLLSGARRAGDLPALALAAAAARRYSALGVVSVTAIVATGLVNSWFTVGRLAALTGSRHGQLLLAKLAIFLVMLAIAALNLLRETPRLAGPSASTAERAATLVRLRRNIRFEMALAVLLLLVVGALVAAAPTPPVE
jgi:putative copper resistance protein D